jgi:hypothetical protein
MHRSVWKLGSLFHRMYFMFWCARAFVNMVLKRRIPTGIAKVQSAACDNTECYITADKLGEVSLSDYAERCL